MQTFLPYEDYTMSAQCLDDRRLGKQRVEAWQIYQCLSNQGSTRWKNHPAVKMWCGYPFQILYYGICISKAWRERGFKDTMLDRFNSEFSILLRLLCSKLSEDDCIIVLDQKPKWLGDRCFHNSHRSNLLRKNPNWYSQFYWDVPNDLPYIWPRSIREGNMIVGDPITREVYINGKKLDPKESLKVFNHSPDGFSWGYMGSGPAQLALAILLKYLDERQAVKYHQMFKAEIISTLNMGSSFTIEEAVVKRWIGAQIRQLEPENV